MFIWILLLLFCLNAGRFCVDVKMWRRCVEEQKQEDQEKKSRISKTLTQASANVLDVRDGDKNSSQSVADKTAQASPNCPSKHRGAIQTPPSLAALAMSGGNRRLSTSESLPNQVPACQTPARCLLIAEKWPEGGSLVVLEADFACSSPSPKAALRACHGRVSHLAGLRSLDRAVKRSEIIRC